MFEMHQIFFYPLTPLKGNKKFKVTLQKVNFGVSPTVWWIAKFSGILLRLCNYFVFFGCILIKN